MEWWQTLLLAGLPVTVTTVGLVSQGLLQSRSSLLAAESHAEDARESRDHERELLESQHKRARAHADEERMRDERTQALEGLLLLYSAVKGGSDIPDLVDAEFQARRAVAIVLANQGTQGRSELAALLTHLTVCAKVRGEISEEDWKKGENAAFDVVDTLLARYLDSQTVPTDDESRTPA